MMTRPRMFGAVAALAVGIGAVPLSGLVSPAVSRADDNCDFIGPVGVGGLGPILGPVGPGGIGPR